MKNLRIGITIHLDGVSSLWANGLNLNVLFLLKLLKKSPNNYQVCLLTKTPLSAVPEYIKGNDVHFVEDALENLDLIILMGFDLSDELVGKFKSKKDKKIILYKCGNSYILHTESVLFKPDYDLTKRIVNYQNCDEVWYVPQQHQQNHGFYKTLYRTNAIPVPFIWHHEHLLKSLVDEETDFKKGKNKKGFAYNSKKQTKTIGVMEPNINVVKYCMLPAMIAEECYRTKIGKQAIEKLVLFCTEKISKDVNFASVIETFDLFKDGKINSDKRYIVTYGVTQYTDIIVSHQLLNPLNYFYMDVAYMEYPILHNAWMCRDLGYYYEDCNVQQGAKQLEWILKNHDSNIARYNANNKKVLARYSADSEDLCKTYDFLIESLFLRGGNGTKEYDPSTNLYKN